MLGVRGWAVRQGVLFEDMCSLMVYFFPIFSCLCLRYPFQPYSKLCVPTGYTISGYFDHILCSLTQSKNKLFELIETIE